MVRLTNGLAVLCTCAVSQARAVRPRCLLAPFESGDCLEAHQSLAVGLCHIDDDEGGRRYGAGLTSRVLDTLFPS
ncbi:hypothetical protein V8C86DRAFT_2624174 [Haematococcus lacustris]